MAETPSLHIRDVARTHFCSFLALFKRGGGGQTHVKKSRNGDTLGPVELIVWPEQGNQGDWREQDG